jgi:Response regulator receiver domain
MLTDVVMPEMSGNELVAVLEQEWPQLPVVLMSGYSERQVTTQRGGPVLAKPFTEDELIARVRGALSSGSAWSIERNQVAHRSAAQPPCEAFGEDAARQASGRRERVDGPRPLRLAVDGGERRGDLPVAQSFDPARRCRSVGVRQHRPDDLDQEHLREEGGDTLAHAGALGRKAKKDRRDDKLEAPGAL